MADRPAASYRPGDSLALDVHVVSDLRVPLNDGVVTASLRWPGGSHEWRWAGDVGPDSCLLVGTVQAVVPDAPGPLTLDLVLEHSLAGAANRYESAIARS